MRSKLVLISMSVWVCTSALMAQWAACTSGICYNSGNVGIGAPTPGGLLEIWNSYYPSEPSLKLHVNDGTDYALSISPYVVAASNVGYVFATNNGSTKVNALAMTGAGNIGIGTEFPNGPLEVADSYDLNGIRVSGTVNNLGLKLVDSGSGGNTWGIYSTAGASAWGQGLLAFSKNDGLPSMVINGTGNVGIGTSSPQHMLHVAGAIGAEEIIVSATGADYVFDPAYRLAPLTEVAAYVKENHHLPEIPSAKEVAENGVNLGEMQSKLLAKIEELTLHMIQADRENRELREQVRELREKVGQ
jgi:hypothetical protein